MKNQISSCNETNISDTISQDNKQKHLLSIFSTNKTTFFITSENSEKLNSSIVKEKKRSNQQYPQQDKIKSKFIKKLSLSHKKLLNKTKTSVLIDSPSSRRRNEEFVALDESVMRQVFEKRIDNNAFFDKNLDLYEEYLKDFIKNESFKKDISKNSVKIRRKSHFSLI